MLIGSLTYYIFVLLSSITLLSFLVGSIVYITGHPNYTSIYITSFISLFFAVTLLVAFKDTKKSLDSRSKNIFLVIILWIILPLFGSFPFIFSDLNIPISSSLFESISASTTTGISVLGSIIKNDFGLLFWRSSLQWLGGLMTLLILCNGLLSFTNLPGGNIGLNINLKNMNIFISFIYFILTLICTFSLFIQNDDIFISIGLGMATISSGGFSFFPDHALDLHNSIPVVFLILSFYMVISSIIFPIYCLALIKGPKSSVIYNELYRYIFVIVGSLIFFTVIAKAFGVDLKTFLFTTISMITTNGIVPFQNNENFFELKPFVIPFAILTLIGGSVISITGGLKITRWRVILGQIRYELQQLINPKGIPRSKLTKEGITNLNQHSTLALFSALIISIIFGMIFLGIADIPFEKNILIVLAAITNTGDGLIFLSGLKTDLNNFSLFIIGLLMILGKIEIIGIFVIFIPLFWRARRIK